MTRIRQFSNRFWRPDSPARGRTHDTAVGLIAGGEGGESPGGVRPIAFPGGAHRD